MAAAQIPRRLLGELLVAGGVISSDQLEQALDEQRRSGRMLGEIILERGFASRYEIASALAEQSGLVLERELGFGSGLLDEIRRRRDGQASEAPDARPDQAGPLTRGYELLGLEPGSGEEPAAGPDASPAMLDLQLPRSEPERSHLIFVARSGRYELLERPGLPPGVGESICADENDGKLFFVSKLARSPLPLDARACAYLQSVD